LGITGPAGVKLAVEMLSHAFNRNMQKATLLAGDLDFKPIIDELVRLGTHVTLAYDPRSVAVQLKRAADARREIKFRDWYSWSTREWQEKYPLPSRLDHNQVSFYSSSVENISEIRRGKVSGKPGLVSFRRHNVSGQFILLGFSDSFIKVPLGYEHNDANLVVRYAEAQHGAIEWE
jgi:hypothetical protein